MQVTTPFLEAAGKTQQDLTEYDAKDQRAKTTGPFTLQKMFWHGSDKNSTRTQKDGSARINFAV